MQPGFASNSQAFNFGFAAKAGKITKAPGDLIPRGSSDKCYLGWLVGQKLDDPKLKTWFITNCVSVTPIH